MQNCLGDRKYNLLNNRSQWKFLPIIEKCVCMCAGTHTWLSGCLCLHVHLCYSVIIYFQFHPSCFFPHSIPLFLLLQLSSLLLFPSLFCKLGALARRRISLFGKGWCGVNVFFSYSFLSIFLLFLIKCYFGLYC